MLDLFIFQHCKRNEPVRRKKQGISMPFFAFCQKPPCNRTWTLHVCPLHGADEVSRSHRVHPPGSSSSSAVSEEEEEVVVVEEEEEGEARVCTQSGA